MDKLGHFTVYGILSASILWGMHKNSWELCGKNVAIAILLSSVFGITMELMQYYFFPGRYFEYLDIIANIIGAICGSALFKYVYIKYT